MPICTGYHKPLRWNITDRQITLRVKPSERRHFYAARHAQLIAKRAGLRFYHYG